MSDVPVPEDNNAKAEDKPQDDNDAMVETVEVQELEVPEVTPEEPPVIDLDDDDTEMEAPPPETDKPEDSMEVDSTPEVKKVILLPPVISAFKSSPTSSQGCMAEVKSEDAKGEASTTDLMKASMALAHALKSESKKKVFCSNTNCNMKTDNVVVAPVFARIYFGMPITGTGPRICMSCFRKAEQFDKSSQAKLRNQENLFDLSCEIQTSSCETVVDLDSPVGSPADGESLVNLASDGDEADEDAMFYEISETELERDIKEMLDKYNVKGQNERCINSVSTEVENLAYQFRDLDSQLDELRSSIESTTKLYNANIAAKSQVIDYGTVIIDTRGPLKAEVHNPPPEHLAGLSRQMEKVMRNHQATLRALDGTPVSGNPPVFQVPRPPQPSNELLASAYQKHRLGKLIFVKPKEGQDVYAMHKHSLCYWLPAKILQVDNSNSTTRPTIYRVQFQQKVKARSKSADDNDAYVKELTGRQVAFKKPSAVTLPVGTRIIAKFKDLLNTDQEVDGCLYAGIVAELPREMNKMRYLVFFDDGYAQYVTPNEVLPVVESSTDVWADVHRNSQEFIRDYLLVFPNRHMIRAEIGASFTVELNGQWLLARIVDVDSSLLKMQYLRRTDGIEFEWIYRGSTRLGPLYTRLKTLQQRPVNTVARRHTYSSRRTNFGFEVNRMDDEARPPRPEGPPPLPGGKGHMIKTKTGMLISTVLESEGNMVKIKIPKDCPTPRPFTHHACGDSCGHKYVEDKFRRVSPLAVPFYLGWARELAGTNRNKVFYHTPCGIRLSTYEEIHIYITRTKCEIPIDFFSMEANIDCLNEFEPLRRIEYLKDISYGKEWTPVTCVNSLDHDLPAYMEYITARIEGKGVHVNDDDNFLTCCDCEDDCTDKEKCACWKLTMSGISFKIARQEGTELNGYENRRLKNHVLSGIYECNRKCKCRATCFNRVVQNKVKWPIQMFKTVAKGWGVRALHDMPQGSFICVYTGQLLTDAGANESGISAGDEYLAELDFIECNEAMKEDYESDCTDIEMEEPPPPPPAKRAPPRAATPPPDPVPEVPKPVAVVAKKATIQKAVKSTGGVKRKIEEDLGSTTSGYMSDASSMAPVVKTVATKSTGMATARKSGSKNGLDKNKAPPSPPAPAVPAVASSSSSSSSKSDGDDVVLLSNTGRPRRLVTLNNQKDKDKDKESSVKDSEEDSDDDDDCRQVYSSFSASASAASKKNAPRLPLRQYFGEDEAVYIMDAKSMGNFGRYLNHSCDPNVFVQNLFVDTHDPRFPWVAFFTKKDVKAGTELTWDYNYDIGSVPGKTLYCFCLEQNCRGRLL